MIFSSQALKLKFSAELIRQIGDSTINKSKLREYFVVDGVSLWSIVEPTLAAFEVPRMLDAHVGIVERIKYRVRCKFAAIKYKIEQKRNLKTHNQKKHSFNLKTNQIDALLFGFSGYMDRDVLVPLKSQMREANLAYYVITDNYTKLTANSNDSAAEGLNIWTIWNCECENKYNQINNEYSCLLNVLDSFLIKKLYNDCNNPCSLDMFSSMVKYIFFALIPSYFNHLAIAHIVFSKNSVKWNISPDVSDPRIRAFCMVGRQHGVGWADIQFGIYGKEAVEWCFCVSDLVFAWGRVSVDLLKGFGVGGGKLVVSGSPKFDNLVKNISKQRKINPCSVKKIEILFCSMYELKSYSNIPRFVEQLRRVKCDVIKFAARNENVKMTFKLHPLEDVNEVTRALCIASNVNIVSGSTDIRDCIKQCDVFVTLGSTATIDALLLGKPVIYPNYEGLVWWDDIYLKSKVTFEASTPEKLAKSFVDIEHLLELNDSFDMVEKRKAFIDDWINFNVEGSSKVIIRHLGL